MRPSKLKFPFDPGFSVTKKLLSLAVLFCFLVFLGLVYAGEEVDPSDPLGEHPWDDLRSGSDHQPPKPPAVSDVIIFPCGNLGGCIIIHFPQVKEGDKDRIQIQTSAKKQGQFFIFF